MVQFADPVVIKVPRTVLNEIAVLTDDLRNRMHEMLERNTDDRLDPIEKQELEMLVRIAEFGQIVFLALNTQDSP